MRVRLLFSMGVLLMGMGFAWAPLAGCGGQRVASPADIAQLGTRSYPAHAPDAVKQAAITALKLQGYEIVTESPRIRTAPKLVAVTARGGYGTAQSFGESVAWDIDVQPAGSGSVVHAQPRASVNGMAMEKVFYSWAESNFKSLFDEIEGNLGAAAPAESAPAPVASTP